MSQIISKINTSSAEFLENKKAMDALVFDLREKVKKISLGGP